MGWMTRVQFLAGALMGWFLFTVPRLALRPTQTPIQWLLRTLSLGVKLLGVKLTTTSI